MDPARISLPLREFGAPEIVSFNNFPFSDGKDHFALVFKSSWCRVWPRLWFGFTPNALQETCWDRFAAIAARNCVKP
jgi:hypothetical protein